MKIGAPKRATIANNLIASISLQIKDLSSFSHWFWWKNNQQYFERLVKNSILMN